MKNFNKKKKYGGEVKHEYVNYLPMKATLDDFDRCHKLSEQYYDTLLGSSRPVLVLSKNQMARLIYQFKLVLDKYEHFVLTKDGECKACIKAHAYNGDFFITRVIGSSFGDMILTQYTTTDELEQFLEGQQQAESTIKVDSARADGCE